MVGSGCRNRVGGVVLLVLLFAGLGGVVPASKALYAQAGIPRTFVAFWFNGSSSRALEALWASSVEAGEERVACLTGHEQPVRPGAIRLPHAHGILVTQVLPLTPAKSDSLHVDAQRSIELCAPPAWIGTVHTHITPYRGYPYSTFSASDREIQAQWFVRHHRARAPYRNGGSGDGLFCVLWSEAMAYCEYKLLSGDVAYVGRQP